MIAEYPPVDARNSVIHCRRSIFANRVAVVRERNRALLHDRSTTVIVAAHPDDEVIGAGSQLRHLGRLILVHATDGAPRNMADAQRNGYSSASEYAQERRRELGAALTTGGVNAFAIELKIPDQEAARQLVNLALRLASLFREIRPDLVLTHSYEGGHPDHDACAFAVQAAGHIVDGACREVWEFTSYHAQEGQMRTFEFLGPGPPATTLALSEEDQLLKRRMLDCFRTQAETLSAFPTSIERYRLAPGYDFTIPPHTGTLYYEQHDWGMKGSEYTRLAREAIEQLDLRGVM